MNIIKAEDIKVGTQLAEADGFLFDKGEKTWNTETKYTKEGTTCTFWSRKNTTQWNG